MPKIPSPTGAPPELMPWLRWAQEAIESIQAERSRRALDDKNTNDAQNSTMTMLIDRLGTVQAAVATIVSTATFSASQVTSGVFDVARIPNIDESKINGTIPSSKVVGFTLPGLPGTLAADRITPGPFASGGGNAYSFPGNVTLNNDLYVPNSFTAASSYVIAYINGDGRLSKGASSRRFKRDIVDAPTGADYFQANLRSFKMKEGDGTDILGYIAEELVGTDSERFIVWDRVDFGPETPVSIDFIALLLAQTDQLKNEVDKLRAELSELRGDHTGSVGSQEEN